MKISIGTDHRGIEQKRMINEIASEFGHEVLDHGTHTTESCDYPDIALAVGQSVAKGETNRGILVCGTGIGMSIAANKINGVRAAVCETVKKAVLSRQHNDANVLCIPGDSFEESLVREIISTWLATEFEGGRHARRVDKIKQMESCDG